MTPYFNPRTCRVISPTRGLRIHHQTPDGRPVCAQHNIKAAEHTHQPLGPGYVTCRRCDHYAHA